jgi:hypothetical protein
MQISNIIKPQVLPRLIYTDRRLGLMIAKVMRHLRLLGGD